MRGLLASALLLPLALAAEDAYLESDGTQAILTDCTVTPETCIVADFQMLAIEGQARVFGTVVDPSAELYVDGTKTNGGNFAFGFGDTWTKSDVVPADLGRHVATLDLGKRIYSLETDDEGLAMWKDTASESDIPSCVLLSETDANSG